MTITTQESRPGSGSEAAQKLAGSGPEHTRLNVTGVIRVAMPASDDYAEIRRVLWEVSSSAPPNAEVVLVVPPGAFCPPSGVERFIAEGAHLASVTVESPDARTVRRWVGALRGEKPSWMM